MLAVEYGALFTAQHTHGASMECRSVSPWNRCTFDLAVDKGSNWNVVWDRSDAREYVGVCRTLSS